MCQSLVAAHRSRCPPVRSLEARPIWTEICLWMPGLELVPAWVARVVMASSR